MPKRFLLMILAASLVFSGCAESTQEKPARDESIFGHEILNPPGNALLCIYDGSEKQDIRNNNIRLYLSAFLKDLGFDIFYHDINSGMPDEALTADARGVISWFKDSAVKEARAYSQLLSTQISKGKKIFIFENFGAQNDYWRDEATDQDLIDSILASSNFIPVKRDSSGKPMLDIDMETLFKDVLLKAAKPAMKTLVVWDEAEDQDRALIKNIIKTLEYAKADFDIIDIAGFKKLFTEDLFAYNSLVFCAKRICEKGDSYAAEKVKAYVQAGGGVAAIGLCEDEPLYEIFNIESLQGRYPGRVGGMKVVSAYFPGSEMLSYDEKFLNYEANKVKLKDGARILARSLTADNENPYGIPLAWAASYGSGRTVYWNAPCLKYVPFRGMLLHTIFLCQDISVFSLANIEVIEIDDFPQPTYESDELYRRAGPGMTDKEFFLNLWWPGIKEASQKYNIRFTCFATFRYDAKTMPPFEGAESDFREGSVFYDMAKRVVDADFEAGFHGYNHMNIVLANNPADGFMSYENMLLSLEQADRFWRIVYPLERPFSYAAPMNLIDADGKKALRTVFPTIKVIGTLYTDLLKEYQEFGPDPDVPGLCGLPRISAGYVFNQATKNDMSNSLNNFGVWVHFIHPDDITRVENIYGKEEAAALLSGGKTLWQGMLDSFGAMFSYVRSTYPWLRNMTARQAYYALTEYLDDKRTVQLEDGVVKLSFSSGAGLNRYFALRINSNKSIDQAENCRLIHSYPDHGIFIFETASNRAQIKLK